MEDIKDLLYASGLAYDLQIEGYTEDEMLDMIDDPQLSVFNEWMEW